MQGMRLLAEGAKVRHAALEFGYSTPSTFHLHVQKSAEYNSDLLFRLSADFFSRAL